MPDKIMICFACENTFVFREDEQERYTKLGFEEPKRCPECRRQKRKSTQVASRRDKNRRSSGRGLREDREDIEEMSEYRKPLR